MPTGVLVIDDSATMRSQIIRNLTEHSLFANCYEAQDGIEGFKVLLEQKVDLIFCDLIMPKMDGFKFMSLIKGRAGLKDIPIIMLTGKGDRDLKIKGLEIGASDFLTKPFDVEELVARAKIHLKIKELQDQLKRSNELLRELSITDPLTHLYNRRFMMETLEKEFRRVQRKGGSLALVVIDIDHFKRVNDTHGHQCGDTVLAFLAEAVRAQLRCYDIAVRYGGEEFIAILPEASLEDGIIVAERMRSAAEQLVFPHPMEQLVITISLGVAAYPLATVDSIDNLIAMADEALYLAKSGGRNQVRSVLGKPA